MQISEALHILKIESAIGRTLSGRSINEKALEDINKTISDTGNHNNNVVKCKNCCIIISELLIPDGCSNCGMKGKDIIRNITSSDIS